MSQPLRVLPIASEPDFRVAVWFSCGAPSAAALRLTVDKFGAHRVLCLNNPVAEEDDDNRRFAAEVADWCGVKLYEVRHPSYPNASAVEVWDRRGAMSFPHGAPCTVILKKEARQAWENEQRANPVRWHVLGFTSEEKTRHDRFVLTERENVLPVLIEAGMTRAMCADLVRQAGIALPRAYAWGLPNANCLGCVKATSPTYWNLIRRIAPDVFRQRAEQSRRLGARLVRVQGERIFLDALPLDAKGRPLKAMPDCGLFCEEPAHLTPTQQEARHAR